MPSFGKRSRAHLDTCHPNLINVCETVIQDYDFTVLCGFRGPEEQNEALRTGRSKLQWPHSRHNHRILNHDMESHTPLSEAVDIAPWHIELPHIRWQNEREFVFLAGMMIEAARLLGFRLRWGGDWDMDHDLYDRNVPFDLVHFELA